MRQKLKVVNKGKREKESRKKLIESMLSLKSKTRKSPICLKLRTNVEKLTSSNFLNLRSN
jgi:hypothetical protein